MHPSHVESKRHMHGTWILLFVGWMVTLCTMLSGRVGSMLPRQAHAASLSGGSSMEETYVKLERTRLAGWLGGYSTKEIAQDAERRY